MNVKIGTPAACCFLAATFLLVTFSGLVPAVCGQQQQQQQQQSVDSAGPIVAALAAARATPQQDESYQRVYDEFSKFVQNIGQNSLGNARRLVNRLNQLVGSSGAAPQTSQTNNNEQQQISATNNQKGAGAGAGAGATKPTNGQREQSVDESTEQIIKRIDNVTRDTDQHTLRQLNEDVNMLVNTLGDSYLRNIRRLIERANRLVSGGSTTAPIGALHQSNNDDANNSNRQPGFPGWDELIVAVDRVQKSLANFVRSSTRLITSGRR